jgi:hypothetical protein
MAENYSENLKEYRYLSIALAWRRNWGKLALAPMALASDGSPLVPQLVRAKSPVGRKVVSFTIEAYGRAPTVPSPISPDPNDEIFDDVVSYPVSMTDPGTGRHFWQITGVYEYVLRQPLYPERDGLPGITMPLEIDGRSAAENTIPASAFTQLLIAAANIPPK